MRIAALLLTFLLPITAFALESRLLSPQELRKRVVMKEIADFSHYPFLIRTPDFVFQAGLTPDSISLKGHDLHRNPWRVRIPDAFRLAWQSEAKGIRTYYFAGYTGGAGTAPYTWMLALSFDELGRPVPFYAVTYGGYDRNGLDDLLDLDGTGPQFLEQNYWGSVMDDFGYYVTTVYQQRGFYWYRSDKRHGAHVFPAYQKWSSQTSNQPPKLVAKPPSPQPVPNLTNDPAVGTRVKLASVDSNGLHISGAPGCSTVTIGTTVIDSPTGRKITVEPSPPILEQLTQRHRFAILTGLIHWHANPNCYASILWASTNQ